MRELHETVKLRCDIPEENLRSGDSGTIVHVFHRPELAYEVEFVDQDGRTRAQVALLPHQIESAPASERHQVAGH